MKSTVNDLDIVGNMEFQVGVIFVEEEVIIFLMSLTDETI